MGFLSVFFTSALFLYLIQNFIFQINLTPKTSLFITFMVTIVALITFQLLK